MKGILSGVGFLLMGGGLAALVVKNAVVSGNPAVILFQLAAIALMVWARVTFGRRSFHATANPTEGVLVTTGPYRFIRHPITQASAFSRGLAYWGTYHPSRRALRSW